MTHDKAHEGDCAMPEHLRGVQHDLPPPCENCGGHGMVGRPLDDDPGQMCLDCRGTGRAHVVKSRDVDNKDVVNSEELIRGMAEMAERFTLRMDRAASQIDELRECLILAVKELDAVPPVSIYTRSICSRARKALGPGPIAG